MEVASVMQGNVMRRCDARTRGGGRCRRPAGWGTDHKGYGRCRNHGGSTDGGRKAAAKQEAASYMAAGDPLPDVDPIDTLLYCVRRSAQIAVWINRKVAETESDVWAKLEGEAMDRSARFSGMALQHGIAERYVKMAERLGQTITQAFEESLDPSLPAAERVAMGQRFASRLAVLEMGSGDE